MTSQTGNVTPDDNETPEQVPFLLRAVVILLGFGIVVMLFLIAQTVMEKLSGGEKSDMAVQAQGNPAAAPTAMPHPSALPASAEWHDYAITLDPSVAKRVVPGRVDFTLPQGASLRSQVEEGHMLKLHYSLKGGGDMFVYIDRATGESQLIKLAPGDAN